MRTVVRRRHLLAALLIGTRTYPRTAHAKLRVQGRTLTQRKEPRLSYGCTPCLSSTFAKPRVQG